MKEGMEPVLPSPPASPESGRSREAAVEEVSEIDAEILALCRNNRALFPLRLRMVNDFIGKLKSSHPDCRNYTLFHMLVGGKDNIAIDPPTELDFPGEDSILAFYHRLLDAMKEADARAHFQKAA